MSQVHPVVLWAERDTKNCGHLLSAREVAHGSVLLKEEDRRLLL